MFLTGAHSGHRTSVNLKIKIYPVFALEITKTFMPIELDFWECIGEMKYCILFLSSFHPNSVLSVQESQFYNCSDYKKYAIKLIL